MPLDPQDSSAQSEQTTKPLTRRAFFAAGGTLAISGVLAACGNDTGRSGDSSAAPTSAAETSAATTSAAESSAAPTSGASSSSAAPGSTEASSSSGGAKATLNQWYHEYGEKGTREAVEKYAADYPHAEVKVGWFPGDYDSKINSALLAAGAPDVFEYGNGATIDAIKQGLVAPLDDIITEAKSDYPAWLLERLSWDGKLYAIPQLIDMHLLVYRKSIFEKKGIKPPATTKELYDAVKALAEGDMKGGFFGNDGLGPLAGNIMWSVGADYVTDNKVGFTDPAVAQAFKAHAELVASGKLLVKPGDAKDWWDSGTFITEEVPLQWAGLWTFPDIAKALGDDFGALPWPAFNDKGKPSAPVGAFSSCVFAKGQNVDAAKEFVKWLWVDGKEMQLEFATKFGAHLPARASVAAMAENLKSGANAEALKIMQENGHAQTPMLWTGASGTALSDAVAKILKGADPAKELAGVVTKVEAELKRVLG